MKMIIKSRRLGRVLEFSRPGEYYIYVDLNGEIGSLGKQICAGGATTGETLGAETEAEFRAICRRWYRSYLAYELAYAKE